MDSRIGNRLLELIKDIERAEQHLANLELQHDDAWRALAEVEARVIAMPEFRNLGNETLRKGFMTPRTTNERKAVDHAKRDLLRVRSLVAGLKRQYDVLLIAFRMENEEKALG